jgi:hypothetical protein
MQSFIDSELIVHATAQCVSVRSSATSATLSVLEFDADVELTSALQVCGVACVCVVLASERAIRVVRLADSTTVAVVALADDVSALVPVPAPIVVVGAGAEARDAAWLAVGTRGGHALLLAVSLDGPVQRHVVDGADDDDAAVPCIDLGLASSLGAAFPAEWRGAGRRVSGLSVLPAVRCLAVGFACGAVAVVSLLDGAVVLCELVSGAALHLPVTGAAFQALSDDSAAFVWVASGTARAAADAASAAGSTANAAVLTLYQLKFASTGEAERPALLRGDADADADDGEYVRDYLVRPARGVAISHQRTLAARGAVLYCQALQARRDHSLRYLLAAWRDDEAREARVELFDLFAMVHGSTHDDARLFAPISVRSDESDAPLTALFVRPDSILPPVSLQARIAAESLRRGDIVLDDHRRHAPLTFAITAMFGSALLSVRVVDAQRAALAALRSAGAGALVAPAVMYALLVDVGLIDGLGGAGGESEAAAAPSRRRALITAALEYGEAAFVCDAVLELRAALALDVETVLGSRYVIGNPAVVLDWALHIVAVLERRVALALGAVEHAPLDADDPSALALANANAAKRRFWCSRAFSWLGDVHDVLGALLRREDDFGMSESGVARIEGLRERVRCIAQQLEFGAWLSDLGLHVAGDAARGVGDSDDEQLDEGARLSQRQQRTLVELERVTAQRRVQRAAAHSAHGIVVDEARMTASSDVRADVPLLIDVWCAQLRVAYPFASVASLLSLFAASGGDSSTATVKQRVALYFLIDAEQCGPLLSAANATPDSEPIGSVYARHFGLSVDEMRLVHGAWLLDSGAWPAALSYFCQSAPAEPEFAAHVRAATVAAAPPVAALLLMRASAASTLDADEGDSDGRVRVLLECAHVNEALEAARRAPEQQRAALYWRVFQRCAALDGKALLQTPLSTAEEQLFARYSHAAVGRPILLPTDGFVANDEAEYEASCRPLELLLAYSLARGRVLDAYTANEALRTAAELAPQASGSVRAERRAMRAALRDSLLDNYMLTLPKAQREHVEHAAATARDAQQQQQRQTDTWSLPAVPPSVTRAAAAPTSAAVSEPVLARFMAPPSTVASVRTRSVTAALVDAASLSESATPRRLDFSATERAEELLARAPLAPQTRPSTPPLPTQQRQAVLASPSTRVVPGSPAAKKSALRSASKPARPALSGLRPAPVAMALFAEQPRSAPAAEKPLPSELQTQTHVDEMEAYFAQFSKAK